MSEPVVAMKSLDVWVCINDRIFELASGDMSHLGMLDKRDRHVLNALLVTALENIEELS